MRLQRLVQSAYDHVPYYRRLMQDRGFKPSDVESLSDLKRFPLLTKAEIRAHTDEFKADNARGLSRFNTGGSSGEPLVFYIGSERVSHDVAAKWRATRWWDVDIGDREIVVWGSPIELSAQDRIRAAPRPLFADAVSPPPSRCPRLISTDLLRRSVPFGQACYLATHRRWRSSRNTRASAPWL